jgi:hypothetical protein
MKELWDDNKTLVYGLLGICLFFLAIDMNASGYSMGIFIMFGVGVWAGYSIGKQYERSRD